MEETLRNRLILISGILNILLLLVAVGSCSNALQQKKLKEKEMYTRLTSEEKIDKYVQERADLEEKLKKTEEALQEEKAVGEATKKALMQEQLVNQSLRSELEKINKLKGALEEDLKDALVKDKSTATGKPKK